MSASIEQKEHHKRLPLCINRAPYRQGRQLKAVKVYTVNQESSHIIISGVPALDTHAALVKLCGRYGIVEHWHNLQDYPGEEFTDTLLFTFSNIQGARLAKRKLDDYSFYGGVLHLCYAPEYETVGDTRSKLQLRRMDIARRIRFLDNEKNESEWSAANTKPLSEENKNTEITEKETEKIETAVTNTVKQESGSSDNIETVNKDVMLPLSLPPPPAAQCVRFEPKGIMQIHQTNMHSGNFQNNGRLQYFPEHHPQNRPMSAPPWRTIGVGQMRGIPYHRHIQPHRMPNNNHSSRISFNSDSQHIMMNTRYGPTDQLINPDIQGKHQYQHRLPFNPPNSFTPFMHANRSTRMHQSTKGEFSNSPYPSMKPDHLWGGDKNLDASHVLVPGKKVPNNKNDQIQTMKSDKNSTEIELIREEYLIDVAEKNPNLKQPDVSLGSNLEQAIIKDYMPLLPSSQKSNNHNNGVPPKFVPRQTGRGKLFGGVIPAHLLSAVTNCVQEMTGEEVSNINPQKRVFDPVNEKLRSNAFILRALQGPKFPQGQLQGKLNNDSEEKTNANILLSNSSKDEGTSEEKSIDGSVMEIRKRVMKFSTVAPPPQLKRKIAKKS